MNMTLIVSIQNSKGGVAKTTTAMYLAAALEKNYSAEVWDADPQGTATEWAEICAELETPLPFQVHAANVATLRKRRTTADVVLIDTPPGSPDILNAATERADVVVIPTLAGAIELARVWPTLDALGSKPAIVLLTKVNRRTISYRAARRVLEEEDVAVFDADIKSSEVLASQANAYPKKLFQYGDVALELMDLMKGTE